MEILYQICLFVNAKRTFEYILSFYKFITIPEHFQNKGRIKYKHRKELYLYEKQNTRINNRGTYYRSRACSYGRSFLAEYVGNRRIDSRFGGR